MPITIDIDLGSDSHLHIKNAGQRRFLLGLRGQPNDFPVAKEHCASHPDVAGWRAGYIRLMAVAGRDLVKSRKHEVFLPVDKMPTVDINKRKAADSNFNVESIDLTKEYQLLPIPDEVIKRFCRLADEMTASQDNKPNLPDQEIRPYQPLGRARGAALDSVHHGLNHPERALRLKNGDFVYFRPADDGKSIAEISYSSLWRQEINAKTTDWVPEPLRPLNPQTDPQTALLSPSEWLFGALQVRDGSKNGIAAGSSMQTTASDSESILAFASKVCISPATFTTQAPTTAPQPTTLKILSSPKPPSPAMYVQPKQSIGVSHVSKQDLYDAPLRHQFKGRKAYLGALRIPGTSQVAPLTPNGAMAGQAMPWVSAIPNESANQKVRIAAHTGGVFYFSVDFKNLSQPELESLCASLSPHPDFEHKIGMGKPLGLGSVKIDFEGLYLVDRLQRYCQTRMDKEARYHAVWSDVADITQLPKRLKIEPSAAANAARAPNPRDLADAHMCQLQRKAPEVYRALILTGIPAAITKPVHYPQTNGKTLESETFAWFVNNDLPSSAYDGKQQALGTFTANSQSLPTLSRAIRAKKPR